MFYQDPHHLTRINISCRAVMCGTHCKYILVLERIRIHEITIRILYSFLEVQDAPKNLNFVLLFFAFITY